MGTQDVREHVDGDEHRRFMKRLLADVRAFERMLESDLIETDIRRIGAEQELFLVDRAWHPAPCSKELLELLDDPRFATELARFNLEFNLDPLTLDGNCLGQLERQLNELLDKARAAAEKIGVQVLLTGILPTLMQGDLGMENMTEHPRYLELNDAFTRMRGGAYAFDIRGTDELTLRHDSVMPEACNTSFQVHFQVGADEFARLYNIAQAATGPVLAAATNSPLLFGKRLWRETRIAVFQRA